MRIICCCCLESNEDAIGSELLIRLVSVKVEVPLRVDSVGLVHSDALGGHGGDLDVVDGLLVAVEHDLEALDDEVARFF